MIKLASNISQTFKDSGIIPLTLKNNTNCKTSFNSSANSVSVNKYGYYKIDTNFVVEATATGAVSIQLYANGVPVADAITTHTFSNIGDIATLNFSSIEKIIRNYNSSDKVDFTFVISAAGTISSYNIDIYEIK